MSDSVDYDMLLYKKNKYQDKDKDNDENNKKNNI